MDKEEKLMVKFRRYNFGAIVGMLIAIVPLMIFTDMVFTFGALLLAYVITISIEIESKIRKLRKVVKGGK